MSDKYHEEQTLLLTKISDQVTEQTKVIAKLDKKVDLNIQKVQYELEKIHILDEQQNELIDKHIEGVNTLRTMHEEHVDEADSRFEKLDMLIYCWPAAAAVSNSSAFSSKTASSTIIFFLSKEIT